MTQSPQKQPAIASIDWLKWQWKKRPIAVLIVVLFIPVAIVATFMSIQSQGAKDTTAGATARAAALIPTVTPAPTNTPQPTAAPPGIGSTLSVQGWTITLASVDNPAKIDEGNGFTLTPSGKLYVYRIDTINNNNTSEQFSRKFTAHLTDDHGDHFDDLTKKDAITLGVYSSVDLKITDQDTAIVPRGKASYALIFDVSRDAKPTDLQIEENSIIGADKIDFTLK